VGSIHSKGDLPYCQTRLRKTAEALIFVIRPQNAAAHRFFFGPLRRAGVVQHRRDDEQNKKDRQQHWRYQPLTKIERRRFRHLTAYDWAGALALSVTDNSLGAGGDWSI
jgi:hypothetical protein